MREVFDGASLRLLTAALEGTSMALLKLLLTRPIAVLMLALGFLSACTVVVDEPRPGPRPTRPPQACTMEYNPVCGQRGRRTQTFSNACQARSEGFQVIGRGECRRDDDRPSEGQFCTREFAPVCGQRGGRVQTFSNACEAGGAGFRVVHRGECR